MIYYHNPRCSKSREGLALLKDSNCDYKVVEYITNPISSNQLKDLLSALSMTAKSLIRKKDLGKFGLKFADLSDQDAFDTLIKYPSLMERPILHKDDMAIIGRPPELLKDLIA